MSRYFIHLAYDGSDFHGWQRQAHHVSVQEALESVLSEFWGRSVPLHGCGRTDTGVHASQYFAHLDLASGEESADLFALNKRLPEAIAVLQLIPVPKDGNAQLDAIERSYDYYFHTRPDPLLQKRSTLIQKGGLHAQNMNQALKLLRGELDLRAFCKTPDRHHHTRCQLRHAELVQHEPSGLFRLRISANRFLRGFMRVILEAVTDLGAGLLSPEAFSDHLFRQMPLQYLKQAGPEGLYLSRVVYPYLDIPRESNPFPGFPEEKRDGLIAVPD